MVGEGLAVVVVEGLAVDLAAVAVVVGVASLALLTVVLVVVGGLER